MGIIRHGWAIYLYWRHDLIVVGKYFRFFIDHDSLFEVCRDEM